MPPRPRACDDQAVSQQFGAVEVTRPQYRRRRDGRLIAGVAGGLADHLHLNPLPVRIGFAALTGFGGFGVLLYGAYWMFVPQQAPAGAAPPAGLAAATRRGFRLLPGNRDADEPLGQLLALVTVALGGLLLLAQTELGLSPIIAWPAVAVAAGLGVLWRQADDADAAQAAPPVGVDPVATADRTRRHRRLALARFAAGAVLVALGVASFLLFSGGITALGRGLVGGAVVAGGAALIAGPWLLRVGRSLAAERAARVRSELHADMAAHLHDSVLQTLALIQRQAADPREVVRLARGQERDLRAFLYSEASPAAAPDVVGEGAPATLAGALRRAAAEVEDTLRIPVEVVTVADIVLDEGGWALLGAAREAMVNAAKHAGADVVDVYAEVEGAMVTVYIRDRGRGFDPDAVPEDRAGVRHSILGRMARHGGRAVVRSRAGEGTEITLILGGERP